MKSKTVKGDVFGKLTVILEPYLKMQGKTRRFFTEVQCTCGNKQIVSCSKLRCADYKQCSDCSFKARSEKAVQVSQFEQIFRRLVLERCKKHNIEVTITVNDYENLSKQNCFYCNDAPKKVNRFANRKYVNTEDLYVNGVDRLDSKIGYIFENCVPCCTSCNYAKHTLTYDEFMDKILKIYKNKLL